MIYISHLAIKIFKNILLLIALNQTAKGHLFLN